ncbi:MAG: peptide chain release factor N(5)-glutamine methyltransferase [Chloroflexota bacterium]
MPAGPDGSVAGLVALATARLATAGSSSPRLDAELLMGHVLGIERTGVIAHGAAAVPTGAATAFEAAVVRREAGEPIAYIRGSREFHGIALATDPRALVPRPETELLVDAAVTEVAGRLAAAPRPRTASPLRVADVGTGSGAIAVALLVALRKRRMDFHVHVTAVDISPDALDLARENAVGHGVADRMAFREGDLLPSGDGPYEVVCANLPYVAAGEIDGLAKDLSFEPRLALDGGPDGLDVIRRLLDRLPGVLAGSGIALLEIGADQGTTIVAAAAELLPAWRVTVVPDYAGLPRIARVEPPLVGGRS